MKHTQTILIATGMLVSLSFASQADGVEIPESIRTNFTQFETDHSGVLSVDEYQLMLRKNTVRHLEKYELKGAELTSKINEAEQAKFAKTDADGDGFVSLIEHSAYRAAAVQKKKERKAIEAKEGS